MKRSLSLPDGTAFTFERHVQTGKDTTADIDTLSPENQNALCIALHAAFLRVRYAGQRIELREIPGKQT